MTVLAKSPMTGKELMDLPDDGRCYELISVLEGLEPAVDEIFA